jgi:hypothetical protein
VYSPVKEPKFVWVTAQTTLIFAANIGAHFILAEWGFWSESSEQELKSFPEKKIIRAKTPHDVIAKLKEERIINKQ